jgi:hypothetical protein
MRKVYAVFHPVPFYIMEIDQVYAFRLIRSKSIVIKRLEPRDISRSALLDPASLCRLSFG